jgi:peroxiredoxin/uncharacterized membrane protein YphA (DoxX/SURF4 family)
MELVLLGARLLLAAVFLVAGIGKLLDLKGAKEAMEGFGIPSRYSSQAGIALPIVELVIAALLLPKATAWWAAIAAFLLLAAFIAGITYNMAQGRHPDCHCFGQFHSGPAGWRTLIRNSVLAAIALFVAAYGTDRWSFAHGNAGESTVGWLGDLSAWEVIVTLVGIALIAAVVGLAWLVVHLLGQNGRLLLRLDTIEAAIESGKGLGAAAGAAAAPAAPAAGLPVGDPAPGFKLEGIYGETMTLDALRAPGKPVLLIFSDPGCGPCNALMPEISTWQREHSNKLTIGLISSGDPERNRAKAAEHGISQVLLQNQREVSSEYKAHGTPSAVLVSSDGKIESPVAAGAEAVRQLVARVAGGAGAGAAVGAAAARPAAAAPQPAQAPRPEAAAQPSGNGAPTAPKPQGGNGAPAQVEAKKQGDVAPEVVLPDLSGKTVSLKDFRGSSTMVLFWNPGCGFCRKMADELKEWEQNPPKKSPKLLIVSTGTVEANQSMGLQSPTVLDEGFRTGRAFGASGTPSAVLVDAKGKITSSVAVGGPAVMAMARGEKAPAPAAAQPAAPAVKRGDKAPVVELNDIDGKKFSLAGQTGKKSMLLFWNPGCGFCKRMVDDLNQWLDRRPGDAPEIILVSTGTPEANRDMGIRATTLLDEGFSTGRKFGAGGTPSAILIDESGNVASEVAVGAQAVLGLAGAQQEAVS